MATFSKVTLSAQSTGAPIKVVATSSTGTTIHSTQSSSSVIDEIWLYATNNSNSPVTLTIQYGGTDLSVNSISIVIPAEIGLVSVIPGLILKGDGSTSSSVYAYANTANVITVSGYVNRIS